MDPKPTVKYPNNKASSIHYHSEDKGCELVPEVFKQVEYGNLVYAQRCLTHDKLVCRCGWEFGWHWGHETDSLPKLTGRTKNGKKDNRTEG